MTYFGKAATLSKLLSLHLPNYRNQHGLSVQQSKVCGSIMACRTARLGGHTRVCSSCGELKVYYNSCRDRHCPQCQSIAKEQWLAARLNELLPVDHFHLVFTVPKELHTLMRYNQALLYGVLFQTAWSSLSTLCKAPKHLGANAGMLAVLHTWGQQLQYHPHIHCLVPAGGLSFDGRKWVDPKRKGYLVPVKALSRLFRGRLVSAIRTAQREGQLTSPKGYELSKSLSAVMEKDWVVYAKAPFAGPAKLLNYLGRYVKRVAISNDRILSISDKTVRFSYRDYADRDRIKTLQLSGEEFIRRYLQHILPSGFVKVRYYGILASRDRERRLAKCHFLLGRRYRRVKQSALEILTKILRREIASCSSCGASSLIYLPLSAGIGNAPVERGPPNNYSVVANQYLSPKTNL